MICLICHHCFPEPAKEAVKDYLRTLIHKGEKVLFKDDEWSKDWHKRQKVNKQKRIDAAQEICNTIRARSSLSGKELVKQIWKKYKNTYTMKRTSRFY